jgi:hypothetical protein
MDFRPAAAVLKVTGTAGWLHQINGLSNARNWEHICYYIFFLY